MIDPARKLSHAALYIRLAEDFIHEHNYGPAPDEDFAAYNANVVKVAAMFEDRLLDAWLEFTQPALAH